MRRETFDRFRSLLRETSGISLGEHKEVLLGARIGKRMRALGLERADDYLDLLLTDEDGDEILRLLDAVSTSVTGFFREPEHFEAIGRLLHTWRAEGRERIRIWSCACATGEEPYSLAMTVRQHLSAEADVRILATDIAVTALQTARDAVYTRERASGVPAELASKYLGSYGEGHVRVSPKVASLVTFARLNLSAPPFPMSGPFDLVLCRNVMIYFAAETRARLVHEIERLMRPGGVLILGHAESLTGLPTSLRVTTPSVYRKP